MQVYRNWLKHEQYMAKVALLEQIAAAQQQHLNKVSGPISTYEHQPQCSLAPPPSLPPLPALAASSTMSSRRGRNGLPSQHLR